MWDNLNLHQKNELMKLYIQNGITSLDEMKKHYNSFATGGNISPDHDPNNPYHYHDSAGNKIVITPEEWEANVGKPYFREIEEAVKAEQEAYPEPEYDEVENPAFIQAYNNLRNKAAGNNGSLAVNWWNGKSYGYAPLPEGYSRDKYGVVTDTQGNYYTPLPNRTNSSFSTPYRDIHGGVEEQYYGKVAMPDKTILQLRQPLPVDRVMNVEQEKNKFIEKYITDNSDSEPIYYFDIFRNPSSILDEIRDKVLGYYFVVTHGDSEIYPEMVRRGLISDYKEIPHPNFKNSHNFLVGVSKNEIEKYHLQENIKNAKEQQAHTNDETIIPIYRGETTYLESTKKTKPSRKEAEKRAVISIEPLEKVNTFADGGKLTFQQWKAQMQSKYPDIEMDNNKAGYDYETYFNDNYNEAIAQLDNLRHFPDTYKLYNHPTFSNESIYSRGPMIGGSWGYAHPWDTQWSNTEGFAPSIVNRQIHPEIYKEDRPYTEDEIYSHRFDDGGPIRKIVKNAINIAKANRQNNNSGFINNTINGAYDYARKSTSPVQIAGYPSRVRDNDTRTNELSSELENLTNFRIWRPEVHPEIKRNYTIPYIPEKEIRVGDNRTSENVLDTLYKYSTMARLPFVDALGLANHETGFGSYPLFNFDAPKEDVSKILNIPVNEVTNEVSRNYTNSLANANYFRNYGTIPMNNLVRDFEWEKHTDMTEHPLLHAFNYFKAGKYNPEQKNHTQDVRASGLEALGYPSIQSWAKKRGIKLY